MEPSLEIVNKLFSLPLSEEERVAAAYRAGADAKLDECCEWMITQQYPHVSALLRAAMRPKPPSLAEQAFDAAKEMYDCMNNAFVPNRSSLDTIRRALERLKELEQQGNNDN